MKMEYLNPYITYQALLIVQALHLIHHRLAKRHISFAEAISGALLCIPPAVAIPSFALPLALAHGLMIAVQVIGSIWIQRLSPDWATVPVEKNRSSAILSAEKDS